MTTHIHATCVELNGDGVLLRGKSGAGKSSLALSLINRGFKLVGDDQVCLSKRDGFLVAQPADSLKGVLEVRGVGLLRMAYTESCSIEYVVDLLPGCSPERLPDHQLITLHDISVPCLQFNSMDPRTIERIQVLFSQHFQGFYEPDDVAEVSSF